MKRCSFNGKVNSILQEFYSSNPEILLKCITTYATSFTGSQVWDLFGKDCEKLYKSWNVIIRQVFKLDRRTHRSVIEPVSNYRHLKNMLVSRFFTFAKKCVGSKKFPVRFMSNLLLSDQRSVFGRNIIKTLLSCNRDIEDFEITNPRIIKESLKYWVIEDEDIWRINMIKELIEIRNGETYIEGFSRDETERLLTFVCIE